MMLCEPVYELSQMVIAERLERAERARLLATLGQPRVTFAGIAAWSGRGLVRLGRRLEVLGGGACVAAATEMRPRSLSRA